MSDRRGSTTVRSQDCPFVPVRRGGSSPSKDGLVLLQSSRSSPQSLPRTSKSTFFAPALMAERGGSWTWSGWTDDGSRNDRLVYGENHQTVTMVSGTWNPESSDGLGTTCQVSRGSMPGRKSSFPSTSRGELVYVPPTERPLACPPVQVT